MRAVISAPVPRRRKRRSKLKVVLKNGVPVIQHQRKPIPVTPELVRTIAEMECASGCSKSMC